MSIIRVRTRNWCRPARRKQSQIKKAKRKKKHHKHERPDYHTYIQSNRWKKKRRKIGRKRGWKCEICGTGGELHVHHKTYERLGHERNSDLQLLCVYCHENKHEGDGVMQTDELTKEYLAITAHP